MTIALINGSNIVNESHPKIYVITPITNPTSGKYTIDLWNSSSNPVSIRIGILVINCSIEINLFISVYPFIFVGIPQTVK